MSPDFQNPWHESAGNDRQVGQSSIQHDFAESPFERLREQAPVRAGLMGESVALDATFKKIRKLAVSDVPVLIVGESGAGKENAARALHLNSRRSARPFLPESCAVLREPFFLRQIFGHVRGAFTGATSAAPGLLDLVDSGTLYLDEVAELAPAAQAALTRCLESGEFRPLGSAHVRRTDFRLVTSTACNLETLVSAGLFRRDLYYRLRGSVLEVPPLRNRKPDIIVLADRFLLEEAHRLNREPPRLTAEAEHVLMEHNWPGNVRELMQEMRHAFALSEGGELSPSSFQFLREPPKPIEASSHRRSSYLRDRLDSIETEAIRDALRLSRGNKAEAARRLGLTRRTLYRRLAWLANPAKPVGEPVLAEDPAANNGAT